MPKVNLGSTSIAAVIRGAGKWYPLGSQGQFGSVTGIETPLVAAGTVTRLLYHVTENSYDADVTLTLQKNAVDTALTVTVTAGVSGIFEDITNSVEYAIGDKLNFYTTNAATTGTVTQSQISFLWEGTDNHNHPLGGLTTAAALTTANITAFYNVDGGNIDRANTTESLVQQKVARPCTFSGAYISCFAHSATSDSTVRSRVNGGNGNQVVTVTAGVTGIFQDTTNSDTPVEGDTFCVSFTTPASGFTSMSLGVVGGAMAYPSERSNQIFMQNGSDGIARAASATVDYTFIKNKPANLSTTESDRSSKHRFNGDCSNLKVNITANTYASDGTMRYRIGGADRNQAVTITAAATGWFEDAINSDYFDDQDLCSISIVGGTSGSITIQMVNYVEGEILPRAPMGGASYAIGSY